MNSFFPTVSASAIARRTLVSATLLAATGLALAQIPSSTGRVQVQGAWARASVPGQSGTGAFMRLTAREPLRLVGASSPAAGVVEVHEMKMEGDVMRMRPLPELALPAGQAVELRPGGYHVMLMDLKAPLASGSAVPITLRLKDARGAEFQLPLSLPVALAAPGAAPAADAHQGHHKH